MNTYTHQTAPIHCVQANGIRFAYRRFGKEGDVPLVFDMHFMGTMDHWDPAATDVHEGRLAATPPARIAPVRAADPARSDISLHQIISPQFPKPLHPGAVQI